jgi:hypothetical protein
LTGVVKKSLLVLGDSHTQVFRSGQFPMNFPNYSWDVLTVIGATISGIQNPNSKTNAMQIFLERLNKRNFEKILIQLGEVDIGFVMWFKSQRDKEPIEIYFDLTISMYQSFINTVRTYCEDIVIVSVPLPTIKNGEQIGKVSNQRSNIKATQQQRTNVTLKFNEKMKVFCSDKEIEFLDLDLLSIGTNGLVDDRLLNKDRADHHYCKFAYSKLLVEQLSKLL